MKKSLVVVMGVALLLGPMAIASAGEMASLGAVLKTVSPDETVNVTVVHAGAGSGTTNLPPGTYPVTIGDPFTLEATPDPGSFFGGWHVDVGSGTVEFDVPLYSFSGEIPAADTTVTATFDTAGHTLTVGTEGDGTVDPPAGTYAFSTGLVVPLTATPNGATPFDHWEDGEGHSLGSSNPLMVTMDADATRIAVFEEATPITGSIVINNNAGTTGNLDVSLSLTWGGGSGGGVARMRFSDDGAHWTNWETLKSVRTYTLPTGDGYKTVRVQYLDRNGNRSDVFSDYIKVDTTPPTGTILINNGAWSTPTPNVTLNITSDDGSGSGVNLMRFSDDGAHWTLWQPVASSAPHTLPPGPNGYRTVRVQFRDRVGNYSIAYNDYINLQVS